MGSKNRIYKQILPLILGERASGQAYIEPFVGGGNIFDKVSGPCFGYDRSWEAISALRFIRDAPLSLPKSNREFTEVDYHTVKAKHAHPLHGYACFALSYAGKRWGGWCRDKAGRQDYVAEAYRNAVKQSGALQDKVLLCCGYQDGFIPRNSLIYCDPPYSGATGYETNFDHTKFWEWCRDMNLDGHRVFVSEYSAPNDFTCIWEKTLASSLTQNTGDKLGIERLFTI